MTVVKVLVVLGLAVAAAACTNASAPSPTASSSAPAGEAVAGTVAAPQRTMRRDAGPVEADVLTGEWNAHECATAATLLEADEVGDAERFVQNRRWVSAALRSRMPWPIRQATAGYLAELDTHARAAATSGWDDIAVSAGDADATLASWVAAAARVRCGPVPPAAPEDYLTYAGAVAALAGSEQNCAADALAGGPARWWDGPRVYTAVDGCDGGLAVRTIAFAAAIVAHDAHDEDAPVFAAPAVEVPLIDDSGPAGNANGSRTWR